MENNSIWSSPFIVKLSQAQLREGGKSLNPSQTALCLLCGTSPTVRWGVKGRQWGKEISQYHKHRIVTVFTAYALQKPAWNLLKIDETDLERQKNEKGNQILSYCYATPVSATWVCIDKQHAIKIAEANFFFIWIRMDWFIEKPANNITKQKERRCFYGLRRILSWKWSCRIGSSQEVRHKNVFFFKLTSDCNHFGQNYNTVSKSEIKQLFNNNTLVK